MRRFALLTVSALAAGLLQTLVVAPPAAVADPPPVPGPVQLVVGAGGPATDDVGDFLQDTLRSAGQPVIGSVTAAGTVHASSTAPPTGCSIERPRTDKDAVAAVMAERTKAAPCLQFARLSTEQTYIPGGVNDMSFYPYARDGLSYVMTTNDLLVSGIADLRAIYLCQRTGYTPVVPGYGSQLRMQWLSTLQLPDSPTLTSTWPCIKDTVDGVPIVDNDTKGIQPGWILPFSVSQYVTQTTGDSRGPSGLGVGKARMGRVGDLPGSNGRGPLMTNFAEYPTGVSWAGGPGMPSVLSVDELQRIYRCQLTSVGSVPVVPTLPPAGIWSTRTNWLRTIGLTESDLAGRPCVQTTAGENDARSLPAGAVVPFTVNSYVAQSTADIADTRGQHSLRRIYRPADLTTGERQHDANPITLNTGYAAWLVHRLLIAVPVVTGYSQATVQAAFRGSGSWICGESEQLPRLGLTPLPPEECGGPTIQQQSVAPARARGSSTPIYFVHGFDPGHSADCPHLFQPMMDHLRNDRHFTGAFHTVAYYSGDTGCTDQIGSGNGFTPIETFARQLAWRIYDAESRYGRKVDVVGHSMGGLVIRYALTAVQQHRADFPPYLYVEDAVTIASPNEGVEYARLCDLLWPFANRQCLQMIPGSSFLRSLAADPQTAIGTDWTEIWSCADSVADCNGSAGLDVEHQVRYGTQFNLDHVGILWQTRSTWDFSVAHHERHMLPLWSEDPNDGWLTGTAPGPVEWAANALEEPYLW